MDHLASGILVTYFFYAIALTVPVSIVLLYWYRREVVRGMGSVSEELTSSSESQNAVSRAATQNRERTSGKRRLVSVYSLAGGAAAAVIAAMFLASPGLESSTFRAFVIWYAYCWPIVPTLGALLALPQRKALLAFAAYLLAGVAMVLLWSFVSLIVHRQFRYHAVRERGLLLALPRVGSMAALSAHSHQRESKTALGFTARARRTPRVQLQRAHCAAGLCCRI